MFSALIRCSLELPDLLSVHPMYRWVRLKRLSGKRAEMADEETSWKHREGRTSTIHVKAETQREAVT